MFKIPKIPKNEPDTENDKHYSEHSLQILLSNKELVFLEQHKDENTVPNGLVPKISMSNNLTEDEKKKWTQILQSTGNQLRNLLIGHHKKVIQHHHTEREKLKAKMSEKSQMDSYNRAKHAYDKKLEDAESKRNKHKTPIQGQRTPIQGQRTPRNDNFTPMKRRFNQNENGKPNKRRRTHFQKN